MTVIDCIFSWQIMASSSERMYAPPAIQRPTTEQLRSVAEALHLHISAEELEEYKCTYPLHATWLLLRVIYRIEQHLSANLLLCVSLGKIYLPNTYIRPLSCWRVDVYCCKLQITVANRYRTIFVSRPTVMPEQTFDKITRGYVVCERIFIPYFDVWTILPLLYRKPIPELFISIFDIHEPWTHDIWCFRQCLCPWAALP